MELVVAADAVHQGGAVVPQDAVDLSADVAVASVAAVVVVVASLVAAAAASLVVVDAVASPPVGEVDTKRILDRFISPRRHQDGRFFLVAV